MLTKMQGTLIHERGQQSYMIARALFRHWCSAQSSHCQHKQNNQTADPTPTD